MKCTIIKGKVCSNPVSWYVPNDRFDDEYQYIPKGTWNMNNNEINIKIHDMNNVQHSLITYNNNAIHVHTHIHTYTNIASCINYKYKFNRMSPYHTMSHDFMIDSFTHIFSNLSYIIHTFTVKNEILYICTHLRWKKIV